MKEVLSVSLFYNTFIFTRLRVFVTVLELSFLQQEDGPVQIPKFEIN